MLRKWMNLLRNRIEGEFVPFAELIWFVFFLLFIVGFSGIGFGQTIELKSPPAYVNDGDTFEIDLNGNGRLDFPQERVRLLYVDTPELSKSKKGKDLQFGLPARKFLTKILSKPPLQLVTPPGRSVGNYGRTLAVVRVGGVEVNLELVRLGHSPFDTRFSFPSAYDLYAQAEAEAFQARRGIWSQAKSRSKYLTRLKRSGKTPRASGNKLFLERIKKPSQVLRSEPTGKFVNLRARLVARKKLGNGAWALTVQDMKGSKGLRVFVSGRQEQKLETQSWPPKAVIQMDGFVQRYKNRLEVKLHYGRVAE